MGAAPDAATAITARPFRFGIGPGGVRLRAAVAATSQLRVSALTLANDYRHPVVLAQEAATLDVVSGGRLELGIGAGWMRSDYEGLGIPMDAASTRIERLGESVAVLK